MSDTISKVTIVQSKLVRIISDVTDTTTNDNIVIVPITVPEGPDWQYLNSEDFKITTAQIRV